MKKNQSSKLFKPGRLDDGSMPFKIILPSDLADLFEAEMKLQDRKKLPLARYIIATYFKERYLRKEFEEFMQLRGVRGERSPVAHFDDGPRLRNDASLRKDAR